MKYINILMACAAEPWALEKGKLLTVANFLRFKAAGGQYSAEEVHARITQKREREVQQSDGAIGVLPIQGVIGERMNLLDDISGGTSTELISKQFRTMLNDSAVKAIILDVNSPGGVARSVEEIAQEIYDARGIKPIVAQVNTCAASAAYWLASQADEVIVTPSGQAGSIGVYTIHEDVSEMLAAAGIKETMIYSGEYKVLGNEFEPLSAEAKSIIQQRIDELAVSFVKGVARGRGVSLSQVNERFGQGLMFGADDLVERGMADKVATMSQTLERFGIQLNPALSRARARLPQTAASHAMGGVLDRLGGWAHAVAEGDLPPPNDFEDVLRDVGISKSQRARIASRVHAVLRSESGGEEADNADVGDVLAKLRKAADGFKNPS
jgi:signal peptide peptidase SppA